MFQTIRTRNADRKDHIWLNQSKRWKCLLCGGITSKSPPEYPTPEDWMPEKYEKLIADEKDLVAI